MKTSSLFFVAILLCFGASLNGQSDFDYFKCSQRLINVFDEPDYNWIKVRVMLDDQVDVRALDQWLYNEDLRNEERVFEVLSRLKEKAEISQSEFLSYLSQLDGYQSDRLVRLWLVNGVVIELPKSSIKEITFNPSVDWVDLDIQPVFDEIEEVKPEPGTELQKAINGIEPGLAAVNAPAMWDLGYTGYGQWALILDTGTDGFHPALVTKFQGLYTPVTDSWLTDDGAPYPYDCAGNGHGTHVAGTTLGLDRFTNDTIGVAFNSNWLSSPAISCDQVNLSNLEILQWALNPDADIMTSTDMPTVINCSWRDPSASDCDPMYEMALTTLEAAGIGVVFSAGNSGPNTSTITDPKNLNTDLVNVFCVASVNGNNPNLPIAASSSRGPSVCGNMGSLLIKPEVSAPGVQVRSSLPDGNYAFYSGTSMAAPHVSGCALLLKEAFPSLTGTELKLALYNTAIDLGSPGEDNDFGMGIVDVVAAFDYLVNQGHTPLDPSVDTDALLVGIPGNEDLLCAEIFEPEVVIENSGEQEISALEISYYVDNQLPDVYTWSGSLDAGDRMTLVLPGIALATGPHTLYVDITSVNDNPDDRFYNNRGIKPFQWIQDEQVTISSSGPVCNDGAVAIEYLDGPSGDIFWFEDKSSLVAIDSGEVFVSGTISSDTTFYVDIINDAQVGPNDFSIGPTQTNTALTNYLVFDALQTFTLKSVTVFANSPGGRLVELRNSNGLIIASKPFPLTPGEHRLELDFQVSPGSNYQLGLNFSADLTFNFFGGSYPYTVDNVLTITGTNNGLNSPTYYYFYDWEIEYGLPCGKRAISVEVGNGEVEAAFTPSETVVDLLNNEVSFQNTSIGGDEFHWDFGDGSTSEAFSPTHDYLSPGLYTVVLTVTDSEGCTSVASADIQVLIFTSVFEPGSDIEISVFPNPGDGIFWITSSKVIDAPALLSVYNSGGQQVMKKSFNPTSNGTIELDLMHLPSGIYFVNLQVEDRIVSKKILKD